MEKTTVRDRVGAGFLSSLTDCVETKVAKEVSVRDREFMREKENVMEKHRAEIESGGGD